MPITLPSIANEIFRARSESRLIIPPSKRDARFDLVQGYKIAAELCQAFEQQGHRVIGRKLGFTNTGIWEQLGLSEPIWAPIYEDTVVLGGDDGPLCHSLAGAVGPRIEVEVVVGLASVPHAGASVDEIAARLEWLAVGFEVIDSLYADWDFQCSDAVAAFGLHRALLVGKPSLAVKVERLAEQLAAFEVRLLCNDRPAADGGGASVLGNPLRSIGYLVDILGRQGAPALSPGDIVTTGTLTAALPILPGETWQVEVSGLPLQGPKLMLEG